MDGTRLGTSRRGRFWDEHPQRLAPSRWTTCPKSPIRRRGACGQVAHTAHSANYDSHIGAKNFISRSATFNDNYNRSGEV
jgi:hypothetical protein